MVIGSALGACFMGMLPEDSNKYIVLFAVSTFLRAIVIAFAPQINFKGRLPKLTNLNRFFQMIPASINLIRPFIWKKKKEFKKDKE